MGTEMKHIEHLAKHMELNEGTMESNKIGNTLNKPLEILLEHVKRRKFVHLLKTIFKFLSIC
jgi:hypothetical protein